ELESALRAWANGERAAKPSLAWYALAGLCATGIAMIVSNEHVEPRAMASTRSPPVAATAPPAEGVEEEIGPPAPGLVAEPPAPEAPAATPANARAAEHGLVNVKTSASAPRTFEPPSGSFYVDEPLRYVASAEGEAWRASTSQKVSRCV